MFGMPDAEMHEAAATVLVTPEEDAEAAAAVLEKPVRAREVLLKLAQVNRAVEVDQSRLTARALRDGTIIRRKVKAAVLSGVVSKALPEDCPIKGRLLEVLAGLPQGKTEEQLEVEEEEEKKRKEAREEEEKKKIKTVAPTAKEVEEAEKKKKEEEKKKTKGDKRSAEEKAAAEAKEKAAREEKEKAEAAAAALAAAEPNIDLPCALPEVEAYLALLTLTTVLREEAAAGGESSVGVALSAELLARVETFNRRSLDLLAAKITQYYSLAHERAGRLAEIRPRLLTLHRTCCLRHDEIGQATVLNLLLRSLLSQKLIDQAYKLASKTTFPESVSNNQFCRYLYYMGRIHALQLDYSDAFTSLMQSLRKAPQNTALAFRVEAHKLMVIVQLLLGQIPERAIFHQAGFRQPMAAYLALTQAVRLGDLTQFNEVVEQYKQAFQADETYSLIHRLRHNVIKTGLRKINVSYSCISLADIAAKVKLESVANAEFIVAKAVRDGVIDAVVDREGGFVTSQEVTDVYSTDEPQTAFHKRTTFCLDVHNEAVKAMRYPPNAYKKELESARKGLDEKTEEELAKELEDEMEDEDE